MKKKIFSILLILSLILSSLVAPTTSNAKSLIQLKIKKKITLKQGQYVKYTLVGPNVIFKVKKIKSSNKKVASVKKLKHKNEFKITGKKPGSAKITLTVKAQSVLFATIKDTKKYTIRVKVKKVKTPKPTNTVKPSPTNTPINTPTVTTQPSTRAGVTTPAPSSSVGITTPAPTDIEILPIVTKIPNISETETPTESNKPITTTEPKIRETETPTESNKPITTSEPEIIQSDNEIWNNQINYIKKDANTLYQDEDSIVYSNELTSLNSSDIEGDRTYSIYITTKKNDLAYTFRYNIAGSSLNTFNLTEEDMKELAKSYKQNSSYTDIPEGSEDYFLYCDILDYSKLTKGESGLDSAAPLYLVDYIYDEDNKQLGYMMYIDRNMNYYIINPEGIDEDKLTRVSNYMDLGNYIVDISEKFRLNNEVVIDIDNLTYSIKYDNTSYNTKFGYYEPEIDY